MPDNINYEALAMSILAGMNNQASPGQRFKAVPSSTPTTIWGHGPAGLFSTPGMSRQLFSAMMLPMRGLQSRLRAIPTNETNPVFGIITGVTASTGDEPEGVCDDPPVAGTMKLCNHSFPLGRYSRMTRVFNIDRAGEQVNRGEFNDFQVFGNQPGAGMGGGPSMVPSMPGMANAQSAAQNEAAKSLFELAVSWSRDFASQIYTGNTTNNTGSGGYKEFFGLDALINTGYRDIETGNLCAAADSIVESFSNVDIQTNPALFVRTITSIMRRLKHLSRHANLDPVKWCISMPFSMFYEATEVWPITYSTYRAQGNVPTGSTLFVGADNEMKMREDMRGDIYNYTGQYLLIDGEKVPVIIDDSIGETQNAGASFTGSIYFVPETVLGGEPVTYLEYFNFDSPGGALDMARVYSADDMFYTSDGGRFLWHKKPPTNFCVQLLSVIRPRLLMLTPYLAARLTDVNYTPLEQVRSWDPSNTSYFKDGGRYTSPGVNPSYLAVPG
jgi:hypothetical protein